MWARTQSERTAVVTIIVDMDFLKRMCPDLEKMEFSLTTAPEQVEAFRRSFVIFTTQRFFTNMHSVTMRRFLRQRVGNFYRSVASSV